MGELALPLNWEKKKEFKKEISSLSLSLSLSPPFSHSCVAVNTVNRKYKWPNDIALDDAWNNVCYVPPVDNPHTSCLDGDRK